MRDLAKFFSTIYFVLILFFFFVLQMNMFLTALFALLVLAQTYRWLRVSWFMAILSAIMTLFWITQMSTVYTLVDIAYAGFFTWYFYMESTTVVKKQRILTK